MMLRRGPSRPASVSTRTHRATQRPTAAPRRSAHSFFTPTPIEDLPPALRFPPTPPALKDVPAIKLAQRNLVGRVFNIPRSSRPVLLRVAYLINGQMQQHIRQPLWLDKLKLPDNFNTWFAVSLLHVWMVLYKTREDLFDGPRLQQDLVTVFWAAVEQNLVAAGITQGLIYSKYLTEYGKRYYGVLVAFDEAVQQGDVQLAEALWRNIFQMEITSAEGLPRLYNLVNYTRRQLHNIDQQPLDMITLGHVRWLPFDDVTIAPLPTPGSSFTLSHAAPQSTPPPATAASAPHS